MERSPVPLLPLVPNLDDVDDDDFFNAMPQLERYDRGDTTEITNLQISNQQPPNLLTSPAASSRIESERHKPEPVTKRNKSKQKAKPGYNWKRRGIDSSKTPKISKHFRSLANNTLSECESTTEGENKCTSDLVGVTDRLKDDTGSPNQPLFESEKRVHMQAFKTQDRAPTKKGQESATIPGTYRRTEESCNEKVSRWFRTHNGNVSSSKKECNDTNNNTPSKAERTNGKSVSNTANKSPNKGLLTPTRSKSNRHKPKKFFDVEGHDWSSNASSPARKKVKNTGQNEDSGTKKETETEMDSDGSILAIVKKKYGNRKPKIACTSQSDQSMKSDKESTNVKRDPLPQGKGKKAIGSESEFSEENELKAIRKRGRASKISKPSQIGFSKNCSGIIRLRE